MVNNELSGEELESRVERLQNAVLGKEPLQSSKELSERMGGEVSKKVMDAHKAKYPSPYHEAAYDGKTFKLRNSSVFLRTNKIEGKTIYQALLEHLVDQTTVVKTWIADEYDVSIASLTDIMAKMEASFSHERPKPKFVTLERGGSKGVENASYRAYTVEEKKIIRYWVGVYNRRKGKRNQITKKEVSRNVKMDTEDVLPEEIWEKRSYTNSSLAPYFAAKKRATKSRKLSTVDGGKSTQTKYAA